MKILNLTLKKKWFDMVLSGFKKEEYREIKKYWSDRLPGKQFDVIKFTNGYGCDKPSLIIEYKGLGTGWGYHAWGATGKEVVYILKLGNIISMENIEGIDFYKTENKKEG